MEEESGLIYGLEARARALTPQYGENTNVRFLIATNSITPHTNQLHYLECSEEFNSIHSKIFEHTLGEVWKLNSSPHDARLISSCYSVQKGAQVSIQGALLTLPENLDNDGKTEFLAYDNVEVLDTERFGDRVKTIEFHPSNSKTIACVLDGKVVIFDRSEAQVRIASEIAGLSTKNIPAFTTGKWSQHHQGNQFLTLRDCSVQCYDVRDTQHPAWVIEDAHSQLIRDLDCNPNKQCHIVTGGDDGFVKIWDCRMPKEAVFARNDHAHWVFSVRFNQFHDQLILSGSSDCKVLLTCASSASSEAINTSTEVERSVATDSLLITTPTDVRRRAPLDGLLQVFDQHEDSVYCVEWSNVEPWIFASLSYDGRVIISKVPKQYKYQIIF